MNCSKLLANSRSQLIGMTAVLAMLGATASPLRAQDRVNPRGTAVKAFMDRVNAYVTLQKTLEGALPPLAPTSDPSKLEVHQAAMAARVRRARPQAKRGDMFGDVEPLIREIILHDANTRSVRDAWAVMAEVPARDPLKVNVDYPAKAALATVPPLILMDLPPVPEGVEYRFMGRDLILRDVKANVVVDFINNAVPVIRR